MMFEKIGLKEIASLISVMGESFGTGVYSGEVEVDGKKYTYDIWQACKSEVQVRQQTFLVQRLLCRYSRQEWEKDSWVYTWAVAKRYYGRPNKSERVRWPVYGWEE